MKRKPNGYWTYERCQEEALKYDYRSKFANESSSAYGKSSKNNWLDTICLHMKVVGDLYNRCIYAFEFSDNSVYVGLTKDLYIRHNQHKNRGKITKDISTKSYQLRQLTEYVDVNDAKKFENSFVEQYKNNGWTILNSAKCGSVGSISLWNKEKCQIEALKYIYKFDFQKGSSGAYSASLKNKWLDEICSHMEKRKEMWNTIEKCQEEALKYETKMEFRKKSSGAYSASLKFKWLDDICLHMILKQLPRGYWTKEKCREEALKYDNIKDFYTKSITAYKKSKRKGWYDDIIKHM